MPTNVIMPQMGESIAEGTLVRWTRKVGESIGKDEVLFEISTDKVDAEIPSPVSGVVQEILVGEGETVAVDTVVARIASPGEATATPQGGPMSATGGAPPATAGQGAAAPKDSAPDGVPRASNGAAVRETVGAVASPEELRRTRSSPLVRKMAKEHGVDFTRLQGTGLSGRVTKKDLQAHLERPAAPAPKPAPAPVGDGGRVEPFSPMRKSIAHHMVQSRETSVHVTTVFEVDFTRVARLRKLQKQRGASITFMPYVMKAVTQALQEHPKLNASVDGEAIRYHDRVNLGVAVALDWGLIVPVVKGAEDLSLSGLSKQVADLAARARSKKLTPDEVQGGTFTITNPGGFGSLFGTPIINQPQVAILGVGAIQKRVVVVTDEDDEDAVAIRSMAFLALSFDHRVIDGADADRFMARVKAILEGFPEEAV